MKYSSLTANPKARYKRSLFTKLLFVTWKKIDREREREVTSRKAQTKSYVDTTRHYRNRFVLNTNHHNNVKSYNVFAFVIIVCCSFFPLPRCHFWALSTNTGRKDAVHNLISSSRFLSSHHLEFGNSNFKFYGTWSEWSQLQNVLVMAFF